MTSTTGLKLPLHKRFNQSQSLRMIRNRYKGMHKDIYDQILALQNDQSFIKICDKFYREGYKDWHIIAAVYNAMLAFRNQETGRDRMPGDNYKAMQQTLTEIKGLVYSPCMFDEEIMRFHFDSHAMICLGSYGFELRTSTFNNNSIVKFLRERMRHFDLDIPHAPMFCNTPADWPILD